MSILILYTLLVIPGFFLVTANLAAIERYYFAVRNPFSGSAADYYCDDYSGFFYFPGYLAIKMIGDQSLIIKLNPVSYLLDLIRTPLLGDAPHLILFMFV